MKHSHGFKKTLLAVGLAASSCLANAAIINSQLVVGVNQLEDTDVERIVDANGAVKTSGDFVVGDTIQTILRFTTVNAAIIGDVIPFPYQLNVYAELQVAAINNCFATPGGQACTLVFAPSGNLGANVFAEVYEREDGQPVFDQAVAPATGIANVQAETLIAELGIGDLDDFWIATTLLDIGAAAGLGSDDPQVANGNLGLSFVTNAGGLPFIEDAMLGTLGGMHDLVGNASAYQLGPNINTGWLVSSNTSVQFAVPEPTTLALMGVALLGFGFARRRLQAE